MNIEKVREIYRKHYDANKARIDANRAAKRIALNVAVETRIKARTAAGCASV